jgi:hypothetical protein
VGEEDMKIIGSELDLLVAVGARAPELAGGVSPGDPLAVAGVVDADGGGEETTLGDELAGGLESLEVRTGVDAEEEDTVAGTRGDGRAELQRTVGEAGGRRSGTDGETPEIGVAAAVGLEDEGTAVGGPDAAALGGRLAKAGQQLMGLVICGGELPERGGVGEGIEDGEAQELAIGRPAKPEGAAGERRVERGRAAVVCREERLLPLA